MLSWALSPVGGKDASELSPGKQVLPGKMNKGPDVRKGKLTPTRRCDVSERSPGSPAGTQRGQTARARHDPASTCEPPALRGSDRELSTAPAPAGEHWLCTPVLSYIRTWGHENPAVM